MIGSSNKIKVLVLYIAYPFSIASYFLTALQKRTDIELKTAGQYTGNWIPWQGGMTLPMKYVVTPDIPLPQSMIGQNVPYEMVKAQLGGWVPDLVLNIDAGCHWSAHPSDGFVATVATDPHCLNYDLPRSYSNAFFNMQKVYSKPGDSYLPYAYSPEYHYPDENVEKDTDAVLIGMPYPQRVEWVNALRSRGVSVIFENGPIFDEARQLYNRGRIGLNWSSLDDLNARCYELCAMKLAPVVNHVTDLSTSGLNVFEFGNVNDAIDLVVSLRNDTQLRRNSAQRAYESVQGQTYDARVEQILKECGFI